MIRALRAILAAAPLAAVALGVACNSGASGQPGSPDGGGAIADAAGSDVASVDAAAVECIPDAASGGNCNSCATVATDPYNVCSAFVGNCVPFDAARVPVHPDL